MNCGYCGAEVPAEAVYCPQCGRPVEDAASPDATDSSAPLPHESGAESPKMRLRPAQTRPVEDDREQQLWRGTYSPKAMVGSWIGAAVLTIAVPIFVWLFAPPTYVWWIVLIGLAGLWALLALLLVYKRLSVRYTLTNQRLVHELGILRRATDRIEVIDVDDVSFYQGIVERLLGVGTIELHGSDRTHPSIFLKGIDHVADVAKLIDDARRAERIRRGLHIESV